MTRHQGSPEYPPRSYYPDAAVAMAAALFVYFLIFRFPFTPLLIEADHHIFLYEAMRLAEGDVMYRDFFQFTFPGSQTFYWMMLSLFGPRYFVLGITIIGIGVASVLVCLAVSRTLLPGWSYVLPALIYIFFGFRWLGLDGAHRMFSPIFVMLAIWFVIRDRGRRGLMLAGPACAFASFFTQQRGVIAAAAISIFLLVDASMRKEDRRGAIRQIFLLAASFTVVLAALSSYFVLQAGWDSFFQSTFLYPATYYRYSPHNDLSAALVDLNAVLKDVGFEKIPFLGSLLLYLFLVPAAQLAFWVTFFRNRKRESWDAWRNVTLVAIVGTLFTVFNLNSPSFVRIFQTSIPGLIVLVWLFNRAGEGTAWIRYFAPVTACLLVLFAGSQTVRIQSYALETVTTPSGTLAYYPSPFVEIRYRWLAGRTKPGDHVLEVYEPLVYFPLHLKNPTAYGQIWDTDYTRPEQVTQAVEQLKMNPPRYILWDNHYNKPAEQRAAGDHLEPLYQYLLANYRPTDARADIEVRDVQIWERR